MKLLVIESQNGKYRFSMLPGLGFPRIYPDFSGGILFPPELLGLKRRFSISSLGGAVTKQRVRGHKVAGSNLAWSQACKKHTFRVQLSYLGYDNCTLLNLKDYHF
jgi:hypothetical protein